MKKHAFSHLVFGKLTEAGAGTVMFLVLMLVMVPADSRAVKDEVPDRSTVISGINKLFSENGIVKGFVDADRQGNIELRGEYDDEAQIDKAFSLAQSVAGVKAVLPVPASSVSVSGLQRPSEEMLLRGAAPRHVEKTAPEPAGPVRNKYAIVVGVSEFKNRINPLQFASNDAQNAYHYLTDPLKGNFPKENVILLTNAEATRSNILKAMNRVRSLAQRDDVVILYVSSHGTPPDKYGGVYIVTHDSEVKPRERIWHTSISEKDLRDFVEQVKAGRLLLVMDACYSSGAYEKVPGFSPSGGKFIGGEDEVYGISPAFAGRLIGAKDIVDEDGGRDKKKKQETGSVDDGWGRVLIGASSAGEKSWESVNLQSSIFTFYFFDGLNRFEGAVQDAFDYAKPLVAKKVREEKGAEIGQNSQAMATTSQWNFHIFEHSGDGKQPAMVRPETVVEAKEKFDVKLWTDKKVYQEGEKIKIYISGNRPFYGMLLYKAADGSLLQLLPNPYRSDNLFWGNVIHEVPAGKDRFDLEVEPPFGSEQITLYARPSLLGELALEAAGGVYQVKNEAGEIPALVRGIRIREKTQSPGKETMASKDSDTAHSQQQKDQNQGLVEKTVSIETKKK